MNSNLETLWSQTWRSAIALAFGGVLIAWGMGAGVWKLREWYRTKMESLVERIV
jgi:hypothetical protein